jgi:hypothetical protein
MDYQERQELVNYYDITENGTFILRGQIDVSKRKECPNCFVMFKKSGNRQCIVTANAVKREFYKCPFCGCRIKAFTECVTSNSN